MNIAFFAVCLISVVILRAGQMLYETGVSRSKNAASVVLRSICDVAVGALCFWGVGAAVLFLQRSLLFSDQPLIAVYLPLVLLATGQVHGALAERTRFVAVAPLTALMAIVVVPVVGHWIWQGFLSACVMDAGGAIVLHLTSATVALVAAGCVGPRTGKYNQDGSTNGIPGHNVTLMGLGMLLMMAGWVGYLMIPALREDISVTHTAVNVVMAACAGAAAAMVVSQIRHHKVDLQLTLLGMVAGMVSTTMGIGLMPTWGAVLLAVLAGVFGPLATVWLDVRWRIDDASGLASSVGVGALVAVIGTPLVLFGKALKTAMSLLGYGLLAAALTVVVAGGLTWLLMTLLKKVTRIRASEADEYDGLDLAEHDINAYPDFQQTMIKSYHLRQA